MVWTTRATAFRMGFDHGETLGEASAREAEAALRLRLGREPSTRETGLFCQGSVDGDHGDDWRLQRGHEERPGLIGLDGAAIGAVRGMMRNADRYLAAGIPGGDQES